MTNSAVQLAELQRANDLAERQARALECIAAREPPRNVLQSIAKWYNDMNAWSQRNHY